jgi:hypothetical protein
MRVAVVAAVVFSAALVAAQETPASSSLDRPFASKGRVRMDLSAGDYRILGATDNHIRLEWSTRDADSLSKVRARADGRDRDASVTTDGPSNKNFKVTIHVPNETDLYVRLTAGDLRVEDIRGNKDIELRAGDARIDVGRAEDYHSVDASLWAGDIKAEAFNVFKDGLFRSFTWNGKGPYRLHAHLMAGDLRLYSKATEAER